MLTHIQKGQDYLKKSENTWRNGKGPNSLGPWPPTEISKERIQGNPKRHHANVLHTGPEKHAQ